MNSKNEKNIKILFTGVHLTPALAVLEELESRGYSNFVWVGRKQPYILGTKEISLEYKTITAKNITFVNLITGKLQRTMDLSFFKWIIRIPIGFVQAFFVLLKHKPKLIVTFGSYVGVPVAFWGWILQIPIVCHEQVYVGGLANSFISKFAALVCVSWNKSKLKSKKYFFTGNPIQKSILNPTTNDIKFADPVRKTVLFLTGKAGAHKINMVAMAAVDKLTKKYNVIHQTGANPIADDFGNAEIIAKELNKDGIKYLPLMSYSGGEVYSKADLVIARSGANTVYEVAALGKLAIFIPIPFTHKDEQTQNAKLLEEIGTAKILYQSVLTPDTLIAQIDDIFAHADEMEKNINEVKKLVVLDADKRIADLIENFIHVKKITHSENIAEKVEDQKEIVSEKTHEITKEVRAAAEEKIAEIKQELNIVTKKAESAATENIENAKEIVSQQTKTTEKKLQEKTRQFFLKLSKTTDKFKSSTQSMVKKIDTNTFREQIAKIRNRRSATKKDNSTEEVK